MAGFNVGALPYFIQAQGQLQAQEQARQQQQMQLQMFQQAQQDRQRQQAAQAAAGNALPQLFAGGQPAAVPQGQMPPPPQPPAPGQGSQPMQQAGGGVPLPQGPAPGGQPPPIPPGGPQGQMPQAGVPPFRPMPTTPPPQQAQSAGIPAPPSPQQGVTPQQDQMEGGFSLSNIIQSGQKQGLSGSDLYDYVQTMEPYMTAAQKAKADQFKSQIELKKLDAEIALHQSAAQNQRLSLEERIKHDEALEKLAARRADISQGNLDVRREKASGAAPVPEASGDPLNPKPIAGYSSDAIKALGEDYAARGPSALSGFGNKNFPAAARNAVVNYAAAKNAQTGQNFASNKIQYAADTAGARSNAVQAAKVDAAANALVQPEGIGDQFQAAIDALDRTGVPIANEVQMRALRLSNDPRVAAYDAAQNGVVSEAAQILGRGTLTVNSMEEARRVVNRWHTSAQARAGLAQLKKEAATTVKASSEEVARSAKTPKGQPGAAGGPAVGSIEGGYRFKGGDPASPGSWERAQ